MLHRIAILVADGFTDSGLSIALDVFRAANSLYAREGRRPLFQTDVVSADGGRVCSASGMVLESTAALASVAKAAVVLVPGLWAEDATSVDAALERVDVRRLIKAVRSAHARGALIGSSCGGAFLLAEAGLLDGREATTTWWLAPHLQKRWPKIIVTAEASITLRGRVLTAGAVFAQADLALHIVARFAGSSLARKCANVLLLDRHVSQAPYMVLHYLITNEPTVRRAEAWVREHITGSFAITELARHVGASPRTLARRLQAAVGMSPIAFVQRLRVEAAVQMLETTLLSLAEIAARVGYADANTLRRLIQRETKASPRELRRRQP